MHTTISYVKISESILLEFQNNLDNKRNLHVYGSLKLAHDDNQNRAVHV